MKAVVVMLFKNEEVIFKDHSAFTLIEMLVVILILGTLALIIIPQITVSTEDTKLNTLTNNIRIMRSAMELYYHEHGAYPGQKKTDGSGKDEGDNNKAAIAFVEQLTKYTSAIGETSDTADGTHRYGPYLKFGMPLNPYNENSDIKCDTGEKDITKRTSDGKTGWKFYTKTGVFIANDGSHDNL
jgi:prepilin-type N-terminal cleavage/methylation domain-containing protein